MNLDEMSNDDLVSLRDQISVALGQRWAAETAEENAAKEVARHEQRLDQIAEAHHAMLGGTGTQDNPVSYREVTGAHTVWPYDSWVMCDGKLWWNPHHANSWRPGEVGSPWIDMTEPEEGEELAWGVGQNVKAGDIRTHSGHRWKAKMDHVTHEGWAPSIFTHTVWEDLGPVP